MPKQRDPLRLPNLDDESWQALVEEVRAVIPKYLPQWHDHTSSDPGLTLLELFAWLVEALVDNGDALPDKAFLHFAGILGLTPLPSRPAKVELLVTPNPNISRMVCVKPGLSVSTNRGRVIFETVEPICLGRRRRVKAVEKRRVQNERLGISDGTPNQRFRLKHRPLLLQHKDSFDQSAERKYALQIAVRIAGRLQRWRASLELAHARPSAQVYMLNPEKATVQFGDGQRGRVPDRGAVVMASYRAGGGTKGNVQARKLTRLLHPMEEISEVVNPRPATGGTDAESIEAFRKRVKRDLRRRKKSLAYADHCRLGRASPRNPQRR